MKSTNSEDQFIYFVTLSIWLLNLSGSNMQGEKKYDDPITISQNIILEMKNLGIDVNIPPNKLRHGYGEYVCLVLSKLVNKALEKKKNAFKKIKDDNRKKDNDVDLVEVEEEDFADNINKEVDFGDQMNIKSVVENNSSNQILEEEDEDNKICYSDISKADWNREVERMSNKLKIDYSSLTSYNQNDWRNHFEIIKVNDKKLVKSIPESRVVLENLSEDIEKIMDKITKKENMISKNFSSILSDYKGKQKETNTQLSEFNQLKSRVEKLKKDYDELEERAVENNVREY